MCLVKYEKGRAPPVKVTDGDCQVKFKGVWSRQKPARVQTMGLPTDESNYAQHLHRHPLRYGSVGRKGVVLHLLLAFLVSIWMDGKSSGVPVQFRYCDVI